jgi:hypothetical protein
MTTCANIIKITSHKRENMTPGATRQRLMLTGDSDLPKINV